MGLLWWCLAIRFGLWVLLMGFELRVLLVDFGFGCWVVCCVLCDCVCFGLLDRFMGLWGGLFVGLRIAG